MKNEVWRIFQYDVTREFGLQGRPVPFQLLDHIGPIFCTQSAYEDMCTLEIRRQIDRVDADQPLSEIKFSRDAPA